MNMTWGQVTPYLWVLFVILVAAIKLRSTLQPIVKKASGAAPQNAGQIAHIVLAAVAITSLVYLFFQFTFAKNVVLGIVIMVVGYKLGKIKSQPSVVWVWPGLLITASWAILGAAVITSGYTGEIIDAVDNSETSVSCETNPSQEKCEVWRKEKAAEEAAESARQAALLAEQGRAYVPPIQYPLVMNCTGQFAQKRGCKRATLHGNATFPYQADVGYRPAWNPQEAVRVMDYGMGSIDVKSKQGNLVTVSVFQIPL